MKLGLKYFSITEKFLLKKVLGIKKFLITHWWTTTAVGVVVIAVLIIFYFPNLLATGKNYSDYLVTNYSTLENFLTTMAAAILGVMAIAFSFAIFSIQYAADHGTSKILSEYSKDKLYIRSFVCISVFAFVIFVFSIIPPTKSFILAEYLLSFVFLAITIYLLFRLFRHTADLVDPRQRIRSSYGKIKSHLSEVSRRIDSIPLTTEAEQAHE